MLLAASGAPVLEGGYEELTADLPGAVARTLGHIGVELPEGAPATAPAMRRQADELSERWVAQYARDAASEPEAVPAPT